VETFCQPACEQPGQETDGENTGCATDGVKLSGTRDTLRMELWKGRGQISELYGFELKLSKGRRRSDAFRQKY
jgi:hypothetical protein